MSVSKRTIARTSTSKANNAFIILPPRFPVAPATTIIFLMYYYFFLVFIFCLCLPKTAYNGFGLGEGSDFSTNVDAENQFDYPKMRLRST
jgi:hypothetical protein